MGGNLRPIAKVPVSTTSVGTPSISSGIMSSGLRSTSGSFRSTNTWSARSSVSMRWTTLFPMPTPWTFGLIAGVRPSDATPRKHASQTSFACVRSTSLPPDVSDADHLDRVALEEVRHLRPNLLRRLLHVHLDHAHPRLRADADADDAREGHEPSLVLPLHVLDRSHRPLRISRRVYEVAAKARNDV